MGAQFDQVAEKARAAGKDVELVTQAFQAAQANVISTFNEGIEDQLLAAFSPTASSLENLLEAQRERTRQATEIGANVVAVERLNAEERRRFFAGLSDDQLRELGDFFGTIETFGGRIAVVNQQLADALDTQINGIGETISALEDAERSWLSFAETLDSTRQDIFDRFFPGTPLEQLDDVRRRLATLADDALAGNESAQTALPNVANQLVNLSREVFGSTSTFQNDFKLATDTLERVSAGSILNAAQIRDEITILESQVGILTEIRDVLQSSQPSTDFLANAVTQIDASNTLTRNLLLELVGLQQALESQNLGFVQGLEQVDLFSLLAVDRPAEISPTPSSTTPTSGSTASAPQPVAISLDSTGIINMLAVVNETIASSANARAEQAEEHNDELLTELRAMRISLQATGGSVDGHAKPSGHSRQRD